jgi:hypothetical protein
MILMRYVPLAKDVVCDIYDCLFLSFEVQNEFTPR